MPVDTVPALRPRLCLFEWLHRGGLGWAYLSGSNCSDIEVLPSNGDSSQPSQHGKLAHVGESVGYGALQQLLDGGVQRLGGGEIGIEGLESGEETLLFGCPVER